MEELKECPFCNEQAEIKTNHWVDGEGYPDSITWVECPNCGPTFRPELWNTRPIEDALRAEVSRLTAERDALKAANECRNPFNVNPPQGEFVLALVDNVYWDVLKYEPFSWIDRDENEYQESSVWLWKPLPNKDGRP